MEIRSVASQITKTSPPKATKDVSKQSSKVAEVINTAKAFDGLGDFNEDHVVTKQESVTIYAFDSPSNTPLIEKINKLESQIIEEKLVLLADDGKRLPMQKEANRILVMVNL